MPPVHWTWTNLVISPLQEIIVPHRGHSSVWTCIVTNDGSCSSGRGYRAWGGQVGHNQIHLEELEADDPGADKVTLALAG